MHHMDHIPSEIGNVILMHLAPDPTVRMAAESSVDHAECQAYVTDRIASGLKEDLVEIEVVQVGTGQASLATED